MRRKITAALILAALALWAGAALALEGAEMDRVEAFLSLLSTKTDLIFVRNGSRHPVDKAVGHLNRKLSQAKSRVSTAEEFIDKAASASSISGKPYEIILPGGGTVPAREYFHELLKESDRLREGSQPALGGARRSL
jgi:predicted ThiF/HesA family dinucleotide-utilizing enzyme